MTPSGPLLDDRTLFHRILAELCAEGIGESDVQWAETRRPPTSPEEFALETIFVICNSGMHNAVARTIYEKCRAALESGASSSLVFGHAGKTGAIDRIWSERVRILGEYQAAADKTAYCRTIPWIGPITCYHLAKSFGVQVAKPDVHLQRLADRHSTTVQELCEELSRRTGFGVATVDVILWRACADRILDAREAVLRSTRQSAAQAPAERQKPVQVEMFEPTQIDMFGTDRKIG